VAFCRTWPIVDYSYTDYILIIDRLCPNKNSTRFLPLHSKSWLALAGEDLDGYGIIWQVVQQTEGRIRLGPGTLYSSIQTLLDAKLIGEIEPREDANLGKERRRYYRLTSAGRKLARCEAERLADLLRVARSRKILRGEYV
jgi:DNA-binding PadR family transcriptional regulator